MLRKIIVLSCLFAFVGAPCLWAQEEYLDSYDDPTAFDSLEQDDYFAPTQPLTQDLPNAPQQTITLKDGTVLKGRLTGVMNNVYMIETETLGTVPVEINNVANINAGSNIASPLGTSPAMPGMNAAGLGGMGGGQASAFMQKFQQDVLSDPDMMADIQRLMADPEIMALIADGNFMNAIMNSNPAEAQADPRVQKLMQNPVMQNFIQKVQQKYAAPSP